MGTGVGNYGGFLGVGDLLGGVGATCSPSTLGIGADTLRIGAVMVGALKTGLMSKVI